MRLALVLVVACGACGSSSPPPVVAQPPLANATRSCLDAAIGLERATRSIRDPDSSVRDPMQTQCARDNWPASTIDCFATMTEGDLGRCAAGLHDGPRDAMFALLGGGSDRAAIAVARIRLGALVVGVDECDHFVSAVAAALACESIPIDARVMLGNETASFWALPTHGLPLDARRRMADVCGASLASLQLQTTGFGCGP